MTAKLNVLAVDDDEFARALLHGVFATAGIPSLILASAAELLQHEDLTSPAVLLLDVRMPGTSGLELQAMLRARSIESPVIFLTGSADVSIAVAAMRAGAFDFVEKPFRAVELLEKVELAWAHCLARTALGDLPQAGYTKRLRSLTMTEREVHDLMITGRTSKEIASELGNSPRTVEIHRRRVMEKMAAAHLSSLVRMATRAQAGGPS